MRKTLKQNLQILQDNKVNIKEAIEYRKDFASISEDMSTWADEISDITYYTLPVTELADHCDENGIWHKPEEWPDIESISIGSDEDVVYLLYSNHAHENAFASFTFYRFSGTIAIDKGTVSNGVFTVTENLYSGTASPYNYKEVLYTSQDDYTIYRVSGKIGRLAASGYTLPSGVAMQAQNNTCLMRYGRMSYGNVPTFTSYWIESDNIIDLGQNLTTATSVSWGSTYAYNYRMQRWKQTGWNIDVLLSHVTSLANFFDYNYSLTDIDNDFSGWVKSTCTSLGAMFRQCYNIKTIKAYYWDLSNVTSLANAFYFCFSLSNIEGIGTWTSAPKLTSLLNTFSYSALQSLDLEHLQITNKLTSLQTTCLGCKNLKYVSIKGWDLSKITTCYSAFSGCTFLTELNMDNIVPPTSTCKAFREFLSGAQIKNSLVFDGWDFSGCTNGTNINFSYNFITSKNIKSVIFRNCIWPTSLTSQGSSYALYTGMTNIEYLDISNFDSTIYTNSQIAYFFTSMPFLKDFYPPKNINKAINISASTFLTRDSILRIFNNLSTVTGTVKLTMGAANMSKMTSAEIAIATNKGWTVSAS